MRNLLGDFSRNQKVNNPTEKGTNRTGAVPIGQKDPMLYSLTSKSSFSDMDSEVVSMIIGSGPYGPANITIRCAVGRHLLGPFLLSLVLHKVARAI